MGDFVLVVLGVWGAIMVGLLVVGDAGGDRDDGCRSDAGVQLNATTIARAGWR